jgi:histone deacetylase 1/2
MNTCAKHGFSMPKKHFDLSVSTALSPIPTSYRTTLKDNRWHDAMRDEFDALIWNDTWSLVPCLAGVNVVSGKWIFCHKLNSDGSLA